MTRIDAIIVADGALINAVNGALKNTVTDKNLLTNRLVLNGRLYSFNHRGGSLSSTDLSQLMPLNTTGYYFSGTSLVQNSATIKATPLQTDLERFRMITNDGNPDCTFKINYQILNNASLPPILQRPANFSGGVCSF